MKKLVVNKLFLTCLATVFSVALSGCVTQKFESGEKPVVQNQVNRDEMAATRISLGIGYLNMGNMPQAKQNLEKAKTFSPKMVQVHTAFAHYYETVGENSLAVESFEKALSLKSDDADTLNNYGVFLCRQGDYEAAEKQILKAIVVPSYILVSKSYQNLASCFLQNDKFDKAEMYLNKAILHSPNNGSTLFKMVRLQYAKGDYQQAKNFQQRFEKVTRRFPAESLALAYKVYLKLGQRRTAKSYGAMLVKMYPQSWEAQQYLLNKLEVIEADDLAKRYQLTQEPNDSQKLKKRVVKLSPKASLLTEEAPKLKATTVTAIKTAPNVVNSTVSSVSLVSVNKTNTTNTTNVDKKPTILLSAPKPDQTTNIPIADREAFPLAKKATIIIEDMALIDDKVKVDPLKNSTTKETVLPLIHTVIEGDTLFSISLQYNIKTKALRRWNDLSSDGNIRLDDKLYLSDPTGKE